MRTAPLKLKPRRHELILCLGLRKTELDAVAFIKTENPKVFSQNFVKSFLEKKRTLINIRNIMPLRKSLIHKKKKPKNDE